MTPSDVQLVIPRIVSRLRAEFDPCTIYLFGSAGNGTTGPDSDIDVLVVVPSSSLGYYQRSAAAYRSLRGIGVPIDVQVYTRAEFDARAALPVSFERTVHTTGRVLHAA